MSAAQDMAGRSIDPTLRLLADPGLLQKRIDQLDTAQKNAQAVISRAGPIEDIERTRAEVDVLRAAADAAKAKALEDAETVVDEAKTQAQLIVDKATQEAGKMKSTAEARVAVADGKLAEANEVSAAAQKEALVVRSAQNDVDAKGASLQQKADELASREQELKGEFEKLAEVRGLIDNVLA